MNNIKTVFFMTLMGVIFLALGYVAGGRSGMTFALVFAVGINVFSYWFSDSMVLRMYNAREVGSDSRLYHIVQDLAKRDGFCDGEKSFPCSRSGYGRNFDHA